MVRKFNRNYTGRNFGNKKREITPYRFVPIDKKVFYPSDFGEIKDDEISFDKPLKDSVSGVLEIRLIAQSDIFTGDSYEKDDKKPRDFFKIDGKEALAGSSVRGVIRNICEVLSFAKFVSDDALNPPIDALNEDMQKAKHEKKKEKALKSIERAKDLAKRCKEITGGYKTTLDMVERVFGVINGEMALKSRVSFSHFICTKKGQPPKFQNAKYISMKGAKVPDILGYKFYTLQDGVRDQNGDTSPNQDVITTIRPLGKGSEFRGKMRYFNLSRVELGMILFALVSFKEQSLKFGGMKYYGYGDMQMKFLKTKDNLSLFAECTNEFRQFLKKCGFDSDKRCELLKQAMQKSDK